VLLSSGQTAEIAAVQWRARDEEAHG
jgi:hypothetical protein